MNIQIKYFKPIEVYWALQNFNNKINWFQLYIVINFFKIQTMIEDTNKSGNTYIEFSFEKSLRKYQKAPCKKVKPNHFINNNNSNACNHSAGKLYNRDYIQSTDRKLNIHNYHRNQILRSRNMRRQFSQVKKKIAFSNSAMKSRQSSKRKYIQESEKISDQSMTIPNPLSEFNLEEEMNLKDLRRDAVLDLSLDQKVLQNQYSQESGKKKFRQTQMQNELSIQKILRRNNCSDQIMLKQQDRAHKRLQIFDSDCGQENSKIIQELDESFSQISISHSNLLIKPKLFVSKQKQSCQDQGHSQEAAHKTQERLILSCAYFSSCSSNQSFSNQVQTNPKQYNQQQEEIDHPSIQQQDNDNLNQCMRYIPQQDNPFKHLKLQSKEQLKKQIRNLHRQRVFYKIKKINEVHQACSQCQSISENLKKQLINQINNQKLQETSETKQIYPLETQINSVTDQPIIQFQCGNSNISKMENQNIPHNFDTVPENHQNKNPFKRARPCPAKKNSLKRKPKKIDFQIEENYQRLGRVTISGLGEANQSVCLSIRRFSHQIKQSGLYNISKGHQSAFIDKNQIINYLIAQKPYLSKSRDQLDGLLSSFIESNQNFSFQ